MVDPVSGTPFSNYAQFGEGFKDRVPELHGSCPTTSQFGNPMLAATSRR
jgi:hypothetical protein